MYQKTATETFPQDMFFIQTHPRQFMSHPDPVSTYKTPMSNETHPKSIKTHMFLIKSIETDVVLLVSRFLLRFQLPPGI